MRRAPKLAALAWALVTGAGCGMTEAKYIDYTDDVETPAAGCPAADAVFSEQMAFVATGCAVGGSCHLVQDIPVGSGKKLSATDVATNRAQLTAYTGTTSERLFNKISANGTTHAGGNLSSQLPQANIDAWLAEEAKCP